MYQHILTAVDHICSDNHVIQTIKSFTKRKNVSITLLHSIRKLPTFTSYLSLVSINHLKNHYCKSIKDRLDYIAAVQDLHCNTLIDFGSVQSAVRRYCGKEPTDLVIIKKGKAARALLQSPPCDMLVVSE